MAETFISPRGEPVKADHAASSFTPSVRPPRPQTAYQAGDTVSRASRPSSAARSSVAFGATTRSSK